jgi:hypothetical protein
MDSLKGRGGRSQLFGSGALVDCPSVTCQAFCETHELHIWVLDAGALRWA